MSREERIENDRRVLEAVWIAARIFDVSAMAVLGKGRSRSLVNARSLACSLLAELYDLSSPQIGKALHLDHSSVQHHWKRFRDLDDSVALLEQAVRAARSYTNSSTGSESS